MLLEIVARFSIPFSAPPSLPPFLPVFKAKLRERSSTWTELVSSQWGNLVQISCNGFTYWTFDGRDGGGSDGLMVQISCNGFTYWRDGRDGGRERWINISDNTWGGRNTINRNAERLSR